MESCNNKMNRISISADGVAKDFNRRPIFQDISFSLSLPSSLAITGRNGAGKSTLSKIISGLLSTTRGTITYSLDDKKVDIEDFKHHIGFVSPYLNFYDEFSALENLRFLSRIRATFEHQIELEKELLSRVGLWNRRDDLVGTFSSGMKQRLKYAFALLHKPGVLILDEPTSNLDEEGAEIVKSIALNLKTNGILIVSTNDREEATWCDQEIQVGLKAK
jgi:heme exporter protein A